MNKPTKIFCIMGYSGTGKDTLSREVLKKLDNVHMLVSHTTRPMRPSEQEGREYHFIDGATFLKMKEYNAFAETREYHTKVEKNGEIVDDTWRYGMSYDEINKYNYSIFIVDYQGFKEIREKYGKNVVTPIYINVQLEQLKERAMKRGDLEAEIDRRLADDQAKFKEFRVKVVYNKIDNSNGRFEQAVEELRHLIQGIIEDEERVRENCKRKKK